RSRAVEDAIDPLLASDRACGQIPGPLPVTSLYDKVTNGTLTANGHQYRGLLALQSVFCRFDAGDGLLIDLDEDVPGSQSRFGRPASALDSDHYDAPRLVGIEPELLTQTVVQRCQLHAQRRLSGDRLVL